MSRAARAGEYAGLVDAGTRILSLSGAQAAANWAAYTSTGTPSIQQADASLSIEGGGAITIRQDDATSTKTAVYSLYNATGWDFGDASGLFSLSCVFPEYPARWLSGNAETLEIMFSSDAAGIYSNYKGVTLFNGTVTGVGGHGRQVCSWRLGDMSLTGLSINWGAVKNIRVKLTTNGAADAVTLQGLWYKRRARPFALITFDDGWTEAPSAAAIAIARRIPMTLYVIPSLVGKASYMTEAEIAAAHAAGHAICTHAVNTFHDSADYGYAEAMASRDWIRARGYEWEHIAYPGGAFSGAVKQAMARLSFKTGRTVRGWAYSAGPPEQYASQVSYEGCKSNVVGPGDWLEINASPLNSTQTLAQTKTALDTAISKGESIVYYGHRLGTADSTHWTTADFTALCDYIQGYVLAGQLQAVTMPEFYRRMTSTITRAP